jgi:hypothetical protein
MLLVVLATITGLAEHQYGHKKQYGKSNIIVMAQFQYENPCVEQVKRSNRNNFYTPLLKRRMSVRFDPTIFVQVEHTATDRTPGMNHFSPELLGDYYRKTPYG